MEPRHLWVDLRFHVYARKPITLPPHHVKGKILFPAFFLSRHLKECSKSLQVLLLWKQIFFCKKQMPSAMCKDLGTLSLLSCEVCIGIGMVPELFQGIGILPRASVRILIFPFWRKAIRPIPKENTCFCLIFGLSKRGLLSGSHNSAVCLDKWPTNLKILLMISPWPFFCFITQLCSTHGITEVRKREARWHYGPKGSCAAGEQGEAVWVSWSRKPLEFNKYQQKLGPNF